MNNKEVITKIVSIIENAIRIKPVIKQVGESVYKIVISQWCSFVICVNKEHETFLDEELVDLIHCKFTQCFEIWLKEVFLTDCQKWANNNLKDVKIRGIHDFGETILITAKKNGHHSVTYSKMKKEDVLHMFLDETSIQDFFAEKKYFS